MRRIGWVVAASLLASLVLPFDRPAQAAAAVRPPKLQDASDLKPRYRAIARGVGYWSGSLYTAAGPVRIQVVKVDLKYADVAPVVARRGDGGFGLERTSSMSRRERAIAGINGSFFSPRNRVPMDLLVVNGRFVTQPARRPALVVRQDGTASIVPARKAREEAALNAIGGGPTLLSNGKMSLAGWPRNMGGRAPRTAAGLTWDGKVLMVTIDGRSRASAGATIREEARYLAALGARDAINLDGGGSSTMVVHGRVVNRPSDGSERAVSNGLMVFPRHTYVMRPMPRRSPYSGIHFSRS